MTSNRHKWIVGGGLALVFGVALPLLVWATQPARGAPQQSSPDPEPAGTVVLDSEVVGSEAAGSEAAVAQPDQPAGGSGTAERGRVQENVEYVIRDGKGRVKDAMKPAGN